MDRLMDAILQFAAAHPEKAVAEDSRGATTYGELAARSASLSQALIDLGFLEGDAAGVYVPFCKEILTGMLAVVRAGGVCVPLEEHHPENRLESIVEDCEARVDAIIDAMRVNGHLQRVK